MSRPVAPNARPRTTTAVERRGPGTPADIGPVSLRPTERETSTPFPVSQPAAWEADAVDITRLDKRDPTQRQQINNAWRALKADAGDEATDQIAGLFKSLRSRFPDAGIEVPAETLNRGADK